MGKRTALKDGEKEECSIGKKKSIGIKKQHLRREHHGVIKFKNNLLKVNGAQRAGKREEEDNKS